MPPDLAMTKHNQLLKLSAVPWAQQYCTSSGASQQVAWADLGQELGVEAARLDRQVVQLTSNPSRRQVGSLGIVLSRQAAASLAHELCG
jgi:hypothetical protein